ncbi:MULTISPECIES: CHAT domain-containing protein [unclassified Calothrix]|uniref:CHAT domain-containing protein n=1 Tax=unclassified Calothrix TaxID=2619626 RepID=UPI003593DA55
MTANPQGTSQLRLDQEVRDIREGLQRARQRDQFILEQKWAVRPRDIQRAMLDINPSIIHFSGHGTGDEGLVFEDETGSAKLVDGEALAGLFELFAEQVECVVLNGCYSEVQAEAIAQHVNYVIGMKKAIPDKAAIEFAVGFYDALGAGKPVEFAHKFGCAAIRLAGIPEQLTPVLKKKPNINEKENLPQKQLSVINEPASETSEYFKQVSQLVQLGMLKQQAELLSNSEGGDIGEHIRGGTLAKRITNVYLHNFIIECQFDNPYYATLADNWAYGFAFKDNTSNDLNDSNRKGFDIVISSTKEWKFKSPAGDYYNGQLSNINLSDKDANKLSLIVKDKKAIFYVNDIYIQTFDVSDINHKGDVFLISQGGRSGIPILYQYKKLQVWSLDK